MAQTPTNHSCPHQNMVAYWKSKCEELQGEITALRRVVELNRTGAPSPADKVDELITLVREESRQRQASDAELAKCFAPLRKEPPTGNVDPTERVAQLETEKTALEKRAQDAEQEQAVLTHQIGVFRTEASALAAEARQTRRDKLEHLYNNHGTVLFEEGFIPRAVSCAHAQAWFNAIPQEARVGRTLFFLPRPPHSLPVHMPGWAKSGYWFHPEGAIVGDREFEFIIETQPDEWCYVGRYRSKPISGCEMRLSEWMELNDETKKLFVTRVQTEVFGGNAVLTGQQYAVETIRKNYETGIWSVPCYTLQCVGYSRKLYNGLHFAAARVGNTLSMPC